MSEVTQDVNVDVEEQNQQKLAKCHMALLWNAGLFCGGILLYALGGLLMAYISGLLGGILAVLGWVMIMVSWLTPIVKYFQNRSIAALFKMREYEVITTYKDGRKESDHGYQSAVGGLFLWALKVVTILSLAPVLEMIYIVFLSIKYAALYAAVKNKPPFIRSGLFISTMGVAAVVAAIIINGPLAAILPAPPEQADPVADAKAANVAAIQQSGLNAGDVLVIDNIGRRKYTWYFKEDNYDGQGTRLVSQALFEVNSGDKVTVLDGTLFQPDTNLQRYYVKVSHPRAVERNETRDVYVNIEDVKKE